MDVAWHFLVGRRHQRFRRAVSASLDFAIEHEAWNVYMLEDGTRIKMRVILTRVSRDGVDENGNPRLKLDNGVITQVESPQPERT